MRLTDYGAEVVLKYRVNGELPSGGLRHDAGKWVAELVPPEAGTFDPAAVDREAGEVGWRLRRLEPLPGMSSLVSDAPHFVDATLEALGGTALDPRLPQFPARGAFRGLALEDLDGDGDLDLAVTVPNRVFLNRGDGTFEDGTERLGIAAEEGYYAVLIEDFDRDGRRDLFFAGNLRRSLLYLAGDGGFERRVVGASTSHRIAASAAAHDVDGDGWLDVFLCGYGPFMDPGPDDPRNAVNGTANQVLRGGPGGLFEDVTAAWGLDQESTRWTFTGAFGDADGDGDWDLYAANDFGPNVLYRRLDGPGTCFRAEVEDAGSARAGFSMSATWADLDGDLDLDLYVSNMSSTAAQRVATMPGEAVGELDALRLSMSKGNTLLLAEDGRLVEAGDERGAREADWAWGTALFDYDADGDLDVHCLNGFLSSGSDDGRDL